MSSHLLETSANIPFSVCRELWTLQRDHENRNTQLQTTDFWGQTTDFIKEINNKTLSCVLRYPCSLSGFHLSWVWIKRRIRSNPVLWLIQHRCMFDIKRKCAEMKSCSVFKLLQTPVGLVRLIFQEVIAWQFAQKEGENMPKEIIMILFGHPSPEACCKSRGTSL